MWAGALGAAAADDDLRPRLPHRAPAAVAPSVARGRGRARAGARRRAAAARLLAAAAVATTAELEDDEPPPERVGGAAEPESFGLPAAPAVVGRVEARALVVDGDRMQHALERRGAADLALRGPGSVMPWNTSKQVAVRALVLVDRHGRGKGSSGRFALAWRPARATVEAR